jgi:hypothetical protein
MTPEAADELVAFLSDLTAEEAGEPTGNTTVEEAQPGA